ncbi:titin [Caerostris extrusa]|uniref:Titin n=1 Tax=Caerostris extrusa TaxID=172846 RepID=A0AAV4TCX6_CAEEX|nr:titin [Caerostris extrusa]
MYVNTLIDFELQIFSFASGFKSPKINPVRFSGELNMGLRTAIMCVVIDGEPPFDFRWLKDGIPMKETGELSIKVDEFTSMLTIKSLDAESNGNYTCKKYPILQGGMKNQMFSI